MMEKDVRALVASGTPINVQAVRHPDGYAVTVNGQSLRSARKMVRPFATLDTVAKVLGAAGVASFTVQLAADQAPSTY